MFANPEHQQAWDFLNTKPIGDYQKGVWAYGMGLAWGDVHSFIDGDAPKTEEEFDAYQQRVKVWEKGYSEAASDPRYQKMAELAKFFRRRGP